MLNLHEIYQIKVYDGMHNIVNTKTFNTYPTVEEIQAAIIENDNREGIIKLGNGLYAKVEKRYYMTERTQCYD